MEATAEPSLTGCYLLIIVSEAFSQEHKERIIQKVAKGLLSWDIETTGCDLVGVENVCKYAEPEEGSDMLIQHATENLAVEVLLNPEVSTVRQCLKNLLSSTTKHKHLIHAGYSFSGSGAWLLQDGTFSFRDFSDAFRDAEVQRILKAYPGCSIHVHCTAEGDWTQAHLDKHSFSRLANISLNPPDKISSLPGSAALTECLESAVAYQPLEEVMKSSSIVGNIRFHRPTLYVFPGGQGDCALFGVSGFNMLIDGGFNRKPCFWEFIRHLDRLDAVLITRLSESNLSGVTSMFKRRVIERVFPQIGYVFCNIAEVKYSPSDELQKDRDELLVSVIHQGHDLLDNLYQSQLKPHLCYRASAMEPFTLYNKVGHGTLEMYVISPPRESRELKDFLYQWASFRDHFSFVKTGMKFNDHDVSIPLCHAMSICALMVWRPADPKDTISRILFPGSAPQSKIFEGLEKLKNLDVLKFPICTASSLRSASVEKSKFFPEKPFARMPISKPRSSSPASQFARNKGKEGSPTRKDTTTEKKIQPADVTKTNVKKQELPSKKIETKEKKTDQKEAKKPAPAKKEPKPIQSKPPESRKPVIEPKSKGVKDVVNKKTVEAKVITRRVELSKTQSPSTPPRSPIKQVKSRTPTSSPKHEPRKVTRKQAKVSKEKVSTSEENNVEKLEKHDVKESSSEPEKTAPEVILATIESMKEDEKEVEKQEIELEEQDDKQTDNITVIEDSEKEELLPKDEEEEEEEEMQIAEVTISKDEVEGETVDIVLIEKDSMVDAQQKEKLALHEESELIVDISAEVDESKREVSDENEEKGKLEADHEKEEEETETTHLKGKDQLNTTSALTKHGDALDYDIQGHEELDTGDNIDQSTTTQQAPSLMEELEEVIEKQDKEISEDNREDEEIATVPSPKEQRELLQNNINDEKDQDEADIAEMITDSEVEAVQENVHGHKVINVVLHDDLKSDLTQVENGHELMEDDVQSDETAITDDEPSPVLKEKVKGSPAPFEEETSLVNESVKTVIVLNEERHEISKTEIEKISYEETEDVKVELEETQVLHENGAKPSADSKISEMVEMITSDKVSCIETKPAEETLHTDQISSDEIEKEVKKEPEVVVEPLNTSENLNKSDAISINDIADLEAESVEKEDVHKPDVDTLTESLISGKPSDFQEGDGSELEKKFEGAKPDSTDLNKITPGSEKDTVDIKITEQKYDKQKPQEIISKDTDGTHYEEQNDTIETSKHEEIVKESVKFEETVTIIETSDDAVMIEDTLDHTVSSKEFPEVMHSESPTHDSKDLEKSISKAKGYSVEEVEVIKRETILDKVQNDDVTDASRVPTQVSSAPLPTDSEGKHSATPSPVKEEHTSPKEKEKSATSYSKEVKEKLPTPPTIEVEEEKTVVTSPVESKEEFSIPVSTEEATDKSATSSPILEMKEKSTHLPNGESRKKWEASVPEDETLEKPAIPMSKEVKTKSAPVEAKEQERKPSQIEDAFEKSATPSPVEVKEKLTPSTFEEAKEKHATPLQLEEKEQAEKPSPIEKVKEKSATPSPSPIEGKEKSVTYSPLEEEKQVEKPSQLEEMKEKSETIEQIEKSATPSPTEEAKEKSTPKEVLQKSVTPPSPKEEEMEKSTTHPPTEVEKSATPFPIVEAKEKTAPSPKEEVEKPTTTSLINETKEISPNKDVVVEKSEISTQIEEVKEKSAALPSKEVVEESATPSSIKEKETSTTTSPKAEDRERTATTYPLETPITIEEPKEKSASPSPVKEEKETSVAPPVQESKEKSKTPSPPDEEKGKSLTPSPIDSHKEIRSDKIEMPTTLLQEKEKADKEGIKDETKVKESEKQKREDIDDKLKRDDIEEKHTHEDSTEKVVIDLDMSHKAETGATVDTAEKRGVNDLRESDKNIKEESTIHMSEEIIIHTMKKEIEIDSAESSVRNTSSMVSTDQNAMEDMQSKTDRETYHVDTGIAAVDDVKKVEIKHTDDTKSSKMEEQYTKHESKKTSLKEGAEFHTQSANISSKIEETFKSETAQTRRGSSSSTTECTTVPKDSELGQKSSHEHLSTVTDDSKYEKFQEHEIHDVRPKSYGDTNTVGNGEHEDVTLYVTKGKETEHKTESHQGESTEMSSEILITKTTKQSLNESIYNGHRNESHTAPYSLCEETHTMFEETHSEDQDTYKPEKHDLEKLHELKTTLRQENEDLLGKSIRTEVEPKHDIATVTIDTSKKESKIGDEQTAASTKKDVTQSHDILTEVHKSKEESVVQSTSTSYQQAFEAHDDKRIDFKSVEDSQPEKQKDALQKEMLLDKYKEICQYGEAIEKGKEHKDKDSHAEKQHFDSPQKSSPEMKASDTTDCQLKSAVTCTKAEESVMSCSHKVEMITDEEHELHNSTNNVGRDFGETKEYSSDTESIEEQAEIIQRPSLMEDFATSIETQLRHPESKLNVSEEEDDADEEMIRHPTPPGQDDFYAHIGAMGVVSDAYKVSPRQKVEVRDEPLYEEPEEDPPVEEHPIFGKSPKADYPEFVSISEGTTPSEPQSPRSPSGAKINGESADLEKSLYTITESQKSEDKEEIKTMVNEKAESKTMVKEDTVFKTSTSQSVHQKSTDLSSTEWTTSSDHSDCTVMTTTTKTVHSSEDSNSAKSLDRHDIPVVPPPYEFETLTEEHKHFKSDASTTSGISQEKEFQGARSQEEPEQREITNNTANEHSSNDSTFPVLSNHAFPGLDSSAVNGRSFDTKVSSMELERRGFRQGESIMTESMYGDLQFEQDTRPERAEYPYHVETYSGAKEDSSLYGDSASKTSHTTEKESSGAEDPYHTEYSITESMEMTTSFIGSSLSEIPSTSAAQDVSKTTSDSGSKKPSFFHLEDWGKPMGLPSPPDPTEVQSPNSSKSTLKSKSSATPSKSVSNKLEEEKKNSRGSLENGKTGNTPVKSTTTKSADKGTPTSKAKSGDGYTPVYVDLTYVPHHGDPHYCDINFFKRIRARYYVFSGISPSKEVFNALLEAKKSWEDKNMEVTVIPTYETDTLGYWMALNQEALAELKIDVAPSASRCTISLQDHETSCAAYRLEF